MMRLVFLLLWLTMSCTAIPAVDSVHLNMEPPPDRMPRPHLKHPLGRRAVGGGVLTSLRSMATPKRTIAMLPAALMSLCFFKPELFTWLMLHVIFCMGSLFEPFEPVLPKKSIIRSFVQSMLNARRAYEEKHGLAHIGEQQFFDEEPAASSEAKGGSEDSSGKDCDDEGSDDEEE